MTALEIIEQIEKLWPEEKRQVREYLLDDEAFEPTHYSPEIMVELDRDVEEAKRGINISPEFSTKEEALQYLRQLRRK